MGGAVPAYNRRELKAPSMKSDNRSPREHMLVEHIALLEIVLAKDSNGEAASEIATSLAECRDELQRIRTAAAGR